MEAHLFDTFDKGILGRELQQARKKQGLTQAEAASIIGVAPPAIIAIEKGERSIKAGELIKLAQAYGCQVNDLVRPRPHIELFQIQLQDTVSLTDLEMEAFEKAKSSFETLCRDYYELEQITGIPLIRKYPVGYDIGDLPFERAAEEVALAERIRLGLGDEPVPFLRDLLEQQVGLRIFYLSLQPPQISGIYHYDEQLGGCLAVQSYPEGDRGWLLAYGYALFLINRYRSTAFAKNIYSPKPEDEQFAGYFAMHFLMPTTGLMRRINGLMRTKGKITPADLFNLAHHYGVSLDVITHRLEQINLLSAGAWDRVRANGLKIGETWPEFGSRSTLPYEGQLPLRYQYLALYAFDQALLSEGQFARFLRLDRVESRHVAEVLREHSSGMPDKDFIDLDLSHPLAA